MLTNTYCTSLKRNMEAIVTSPADATCIKGLVYLEDECLKCSKCTANLPFRCSELSDYMLLRFKKSQASYVCRTSVLAEGDTTNLDAQQISIENTIKKEVEAIKKAAYNDSIDALINQEQSNSKCRTNSENYSPKGSSEKICKFYLRRTCKHGKKWEL